MSKIERIVFISGRIGSGKTSLATEIAKRLDCPFASFGDAVRAEAATLGLPRADRVILQRIGQRLVDEEPERFCRLVLDRIADNASCAIVEGLRHARLLWVLKKVAGNARVEVIFVDLGRLERFRRLREYRGYSDEVCRQYDNDPTEIELDGSLKELADVVVDNGGNLQDAVDACMMWIRSGTK